MPFKTTFFVRPWDNYDSSAYEKGIKVDDIILKVNGKSTANKDLAYVISLIRGEVNTQVTLKIARLGQKNKNFKLTRSRFRNDNIAESYFYRGNARFDLKNYRGAIEDYTQAIHLNPGDSSNIYRNRGNVYFNLGEYQEAIKDYTQAIYLNPDDADTYYNRGNAYSNLKDYQRAIDDYSQAIEIDPNYADAYNNRGAIFYNHLGDMQRGIADLRKAANLGSKTAEENLRNHQNIK